MIKVAIGVTVPSMEAWYLCEKNSAVGEAVWIRKLNGEKVGYDRVSLKKQVYGERPFARKRAEKILEEANRLAQNPEQLEKLFPEGFGNMASEIRSWKK